MWRAPRVRDVSVFFVTAASLLLLAGCDLIRDPDAPPVYTPSMTLEVVSVESWVRFGRSIARISDVNQDSVPELGTSTSDDRVHLFDGADGHLLRSITSPNAGEQLSSRFGEDVAGVGDVDGDGAGDLLVGAKGERVGGRRSAGRAYLFSGADGRLLQTLVSPNTQGNGNFGHAVARANDVNGDSVPDLLVGANLESVGDSSQAGRAYLFSGADGRLLQTLVSPRPIEDGQFGQDVAGVGDVNGDSVPDLFIGAPAPEPDFVLFGASSNPKDDHRGSGHVYLFSGADGSLLREIESPNPEKDGRFGGTVAGIDDLNGDAVPDLVVGASREVNGDRDDVGRVYLFRGRDGGLLQVLRSPNPEERGYFGRSFATVGDVSGNEVPDLVVGAHHETAEGHQRAGHAYLFDGGSGALLQTLRSPNPQPSGSFGGSIAVSDGDEDGVPDLIIGAWGEEQGNQEASGQVYVFRRSP